jgi:hypothetical protein
MISLAAVSRKLNHSVKDSDMRALIVTAKSSLALAGTDFLVKVLTGMLVGMLGQRARVAAGMKKTFNEAAVQLKPSWHATSQQVQGLSGLQRGLK